MKKVCSLQLYRLGRASQHFPFNSRGNPLVSIRISLQKASVVCAERRLEMLFEHIQRNRTLHDTSTDEYDELNEFSVR